MTSVLAIDLGAASGRVGLVRIDRGRLALTELGRFANIPVSVGGTLYWDVLRLYRSVLDGLRAAGATAGQVDSIGVDSWAVDYGLLDADGALLGNPIHYRDRGSDGVLSRVLAEGHGPELYAVTGIQFLPFNTLYQLLARTGSAQLAAASTLLLIPDLMTYWLTGTVRAELTNASTTQLLDVRTGRWASDLTRRFGIPPALLAPLCRPGDRAGHLLGEVAATTGLARETPVTAVGSHDTASAVVGIPAAAEPFAYISCGTWSLVGVELDRPVLTAASRVAGFTNEAGVDGTVRYLRNVMGLWLLQESLRVWSAGGIRVDLGELLRLAGRLRPLSAIIDPDDQALLPPGDMPARIAESCLNTGQPPPDSPAATVRCILDNLALAHHRAVTDACRLSGRDVGVLHLVGGGSRNELLCQLTADACGLPVEAGPAEATLLGNALVQARALGAVGDDLPAMRSLLRRQLPPRRYEPGGDRAAWQRAASIQSQLADG
ncbi:MAG: rhamnulokinase [Dactylosporangium sp.]|nr:rhamnulokinase [Dactylosporangium sp.]NNJ59397.1 rhamnulokinase [Dactylosporangium sp.]